jgi:hypothetical protein
MVLRAWHINCFIRDGVVVVLDALVCSNKDPVSAKKALSMVQLRGCEAVLDLNRLAVHMLLMLVLQICREAGTSESAPVGIQACVWGIDGYRQCAFWRCLLGC